MHIDFLLATNNSESETTRKFRVKTGAADLSSEDHNMDALKGFAQLTIGE